MLTLLAFAAYALLAPDHIVDGDNAEFSTLAQTGGTAHPTGYPLYLLWLRALAWLPGSPAHAAALATAILGAATVLALHAACRAWGAGALGATIVTTLFAAAPIVVRIATTAEVFALNDLVVAVVLWLAATHGPLRGHRRAIALAVVAGLGMCNHMTCALVAPIGVLGIVRGVRESSWTALPAAVGAFAVALLPYAYLIITPDTPLSWGKVETLDDLVAMITRQDYGGPGAFLPQGKAVAATTQLAAFATSIGRTWLWLPLAAAIYGVARELVKPSHETRWGWVCFVATWLIAGPLLVMRFNIDPTGLGLYVVQRFYVLPAMLLAIAVAVAFRPLEDMRRARLATGLAGTLGFATVMATTLPYIARMHTPAVERYATNLLGVMPENAVLFMGQDSDYFGTAYAQWALGKRTDVVVVAPQLTVMTWYAERIAKRGIAPPPGEGHPMVRLVEKLLREGRPVFVEKSRAEIISTFTTYPYGTVMKVLPIGAPTPPIDVVVAENKALYARFELGYPLPGTDDEYATAIHHRYAGTWLTLGKKLAEAGKREDAAWALEAARAIGPQP